MIYSQCFPLPFHEGLWCYDPKSEKFFPSSFFSLKKGFKKKKAEIAKIRKRLGSRLTSHRRRALSKLLHKTLQEKERFLKRIALVKENQSLTFQTLKEESAYLLGYYEDEWKGYRMSIYFKRGKFYDLKDKYIANEALATEARKNASEAIENVKNLEIIFNKLQTECGDVLASTLDYTRSSLIEAQKKASYFTKVLEEVQKKVLKTKTLFSFSRLYLSGLKKKVHENFKKMKMSIYINDWLFEFFDYSLSNDKMASAMKSAIENAEKKALEDLSNGIKKLRSN